MQGVCVLQVIPAVEAGGAERTTLEVARAVVAAGGKAVVCSSGGRLVPALEAVGARHVTLPMASKNPAQMWRSRGRLARLVRRERVSLVHARSRAPAWPALGAARRMGVPFVTTWHGAYSGRTGAKLLYNSVMARGDVVIANSAFTAEAIREAYIEWRFLEGRRIVVVPRGADIADFSPHEVSKDRLASATAAFGDAPLKVLLPGRMTPWKGQVQAIEAADLLRGAGLLRGANLAPPLRMALIGSAVGARDYERALRRMIAEAGLEDTVHLHDHWDDMPAAYAWADVVLSASTRPEAFGRVAVEAMAMGRPVVATDHGGSRETVLHEETGLLVPPGDPAGLAAGIERLSDPALRLQMGRAGKARARERFTTQAMTDAVLTVYREVLAEKERAGGRRWGRTAIAD